MISKDKTYRTRDGREVRIYATDGDNGGTIHGAIFLNGWQFRLWYSNGSYDRDAETSLDLIEVKPRIKRTVWLHIYDNYTKVSDTTIRLTMNKPRACVKVDIDCEEGEGL